MMISKKICKFYYLEDMLDANGQCNLAVMEMITLRGKVSLTYQVQCSQRLAWNFKTKFYTLTGI